MDDLEDFESARLVLDSTVIAIDDFERLASSFVEKSTHTVVHRIDGETGEEVFSFKFGERIPKTMRVLASRIVSEIKHALDQALSDAAFACGRSNRNSVHFPIGKSLADFEGEVVRRCRRVRTELTDFVRNVKPYYGGNSSLYLFLAKAGASKHQRILQISFLEYGFLLRTPRDGFTHIPMGRFGSLGWNEAHNQLDFLRTGNGQAYKADFSPVVQVVLEMGEAPLSGDATALFRDMLGEARSIIDGLEAETVRIKAIIGTEQGGTHGEGSQHTG